MIISVNFMLDHFRQMYVLMMLSVSGWVSLAYLVDVMLGEDAIKESVEVIEKVNHLHRGGPGRQGGKAHDVREVD